MISVKKLEEQASLQQIFEEPWVLVFKDSPRCGISQAVKKKVKKFAESCTGDMRLYTVDVRKNTDISREIEKRTGVMHESPQVLILKKGRVVWHASHWDITLMALKEAIK